MYLRSEFAQNGRGGLINEGGVISSEYGTQIVDDSVDERPGYEAIVFIVL